MVKDYYENIFAGSSEVEVEDMVSANVVFTEQNGRLVVEMTYEEFTTAVKQMHPDKATGPDGLNPGFF